MNKLMYYPSILIPSEWIKKAILYTDEISSIYPYSFTSVEGIRERQSLADMQFLEAEGLYRYSRPEELSSDKFNRILSDLIIDFDESKLKILRENFKSDVVKYEIYKSKMDGEIGRFLVSNGLAKNNDFHCNGNSLVVEKETALKYMSLLATYSVFELGNYNVATDTIQHQSTLFTGNIKNGENYMQIIFNKIPQPIESVSLEDIIAFKKRHRNELLEYRSFINNNVKILNKDSSIEAFNCFCDDFERYSLEISQMFKSKRIDFSFDALEILAPLVVSGGISYFQNSISPEAILAGVGTAAASIGVKKIRTAFTGSPRNNPMNYLLEAKKNIIIENIV